MNDETAATDVAASHILARNDHRNPGMDLDIAMFEGHGANTDAEAFVAWIKAL